MRRPTNVPGDYSTFIAQRYGTAALVTFDRHYRELVARGVSAGVARRQTIDYLHTCPRCGNVVSSHKRRSNRRQNVDGRLEHVTC